MDAVVELVVFTLGCADQVVLTVARLRIIWVSVLVTDSDMNYFLRLLQQQTPYAMTNGNKYIIDCSVL